MTTYGGALKEPQLFVRECFREDKYSFPVNSACPKSQIQVGNIHRFTPKIFASRWCIPFVVSPTVISIPVFAKGASSLMQMDLQP